MSSDTQLNRDSYYEASVVRPALQLRLQEDVQADVVVVGAGYAGLSAAIELAQRGYAVVVLEADRVCSGASGRNGGQAIVGYASGQQPFQKQLGREASHAVWDMSLQALALIDERIKQFEIDCDRVHGYLHVATSLRKARALENDLRVLRRDHGWEAEMIHGIELRAHVDSPRYCAAAFERDSGHLHPLKYGLGLMHAAQSLGVRIFEHSGALTLQRGARLRAFTKDGSVSADFCVLAGNCTLAEWSPKVAPELAGRIMPVGTYMAATEPLPSEVVRKLLPRNAAVADNNFVLDYFRLSVDGRLLFGAGVSYSTRTPSRLVEKMKQRMLAVFPQLVGVAVHYTWGGFVDISMNRAPDFGRISPNIYYLQGFSGHGVALTGLAGQLIAQAVAGQAERFDVLASLKHSRFPGGEPLRMPVLVLGMLYHRLKDLF